MFISTLRHRRNNKLIILGVIRIRLIERGENMLILGSNGFSYTQIRQKIGEHIPDRSGNMLIIPLASMFEKETGQNEKDNAALLDFKEENIFVFDEVEPEEYLKRKYDYIVVLGGNTFKLLHGVRKYKLDRFIKQQVADGAIYIGFSAGAYLACRNEKKKKNFDDNNHITDGDFTALGLTDEYVLCHFDYRGIEEIKMCRLFLGDETKMITINEDQLIVLQ